MTVDGLVRRRRTTGVLLALIVLMATVLVFIPQVEAQVPTDNDWSEFTFVFANGTIIGGDNKPGSPYVYPPDGGDRKKNQAWFPGTGGAFPYMDPDAPGMAIHVSCSDTFENGWGKGGTLNQPIAGVDTNWQIAGYFIAKYTNGEPTSHCGESFIPASITVVKETVPETTDSFTFSLFGIIPPTPTEPASYWPSDYAQGGPDVQTVAGNGGEYTWSEVPMGTYSLEEITGENPTGYQFDGVSCTSELGVAYELLTAGALINVKASDHVTCTFSNSAEVEPASARLTVAKVVDTAGAPAQLFDFSVTGEAVFSLADGGSESFDFEFPAGETLDVTATELAGLPVGWSFESVSCTGWDGSSASPAAQVTLSDGDDVTCTFHNSYTPAAAKLTVEKVVDTANAPAQSFDFTVTGQAGFSLADGEWKSFDYEFAAGGSVAVDVEELTANLPARWSFESLTCTGWEGSSSEPIAEIVLTNGADITCTFTNSYTPPVITTTTTTIPETGSIGDLVWEDANSNGVQDPGELGIPGVIVELFDADTDQLLGIRVTDANGNYLFEDLPAGDYYLVFTLPNADDEFIAPNVGGDPALDSDADNVTNIGRTTSVISLSAGEDLTWDAGVAFVEVGGVVVTTTPETLPFTGADVGEGGLAGFALALLAMGGIALLAVRRREEQAEVVSGWSGRLWDVE